MVLGAFFAAMATLQGQGRPLPAALAYLCGAFLLSPMLAYLFAFKVRLGCPLDCDESPLVGLWWGFSAGYLVTVIIACTAALLSDWEALAQTAQLRSEAARVEQEASLATDGNVQSGRARMAPGEDEDIPNDLLRVITAQSGVGSMRAPLVENEGR